MSTSTDEFPCGAEGENCKFEPFVNPDGIHNVRCIRCKRPGVRVEIERASDLFGNADG